ncbi:uncharacterized protein LOC118438333 [Folsomia candida]|uniref:Uncharacterized protein n=1 Tax=Folsomia candida TaxID=158441 RepID=A0A226DGJ0_FOLCA|nr:uncharacterized protein LOC118438333 [Folsomia candida]XP_035714203.1 uncharacterized protein LOC118438333 [Folsomia candida]XP_035714204.1 uncharacterized protein LOC118438333 [Folsomia candida]OXA44665.1 hypothetical protein Fcan01_20717 [Folsomia candida]
MDELVMTTAMIYHKADLLENCVAENMKDAPLIQRNVTPYEFMESRWWDAAMAPYFKLPLAFDGGAGVPVDEKWAPLGTRICVYIRKAVDILIRHNELVDIFHDLRSKEPMNEVHLAARYGGLAAVKNYAVACAACVDEVATCKCIAGDVSHDYATDLAIGSVAWYPIVPHYRVLTQLAETRHLTRSKYTALAAKTNHGAFITSDMADSGEHGAFHNDEWESLTTLTSLEPFISGECQHCGVISDWVINRCLYRDDRKEKGKTLRKFVMDALHLKRDKKMDGFFGEILTIAAGDEFPAFLVKQCITAVEAVWQTLRAAGTDLPPNVVAGQVVENHVRIDKAFIETHNHPGAHALRRALSGTLSIMMDRTDVSPYPRILDAAVIHSIKMGSVINHGKV